MQPDRFTEFRIERRRLENRLEDIRQTAEALQIKRKGRAGDRLMEPVRLGVRRDAGTASGFARYIGIFEVDDGYGSAVVSATHSKTERTTAPEPIEGWVEISADVLEAAARSGSDEVRIRIEDDQSDVGTPGGKATAVIEDEAVESRTPCVYRTGPDGQIAEEEPGPGHGVFTADYGELERHLSALQEGEPQNWGDRWRGARIEIPKPQSDGDGGGPATAAYVVEEIGCTYRGVLKSAGSEKTRNEYAPGTAWIPRRVITALKRRPMAAPNGAVVISGCGVTGRGRIRRTDGDGCITWQRGYEPAGGGKTRSPGTPGCVEARLHTEALRRAARMEALEAERAGHGPNDTCLLIDLRTGDAEGLETRAAGRNTVLEGPAGAEKATVRIKARDILNWPRSAAGSPVGTGSVRLPARPPIGIYPEGTRIELLNGWKGTSTAVLETETA